MKVKIGKNKEKTPMKQVNLKWFTKKFKDFEIFAICYSKKWRWIGGAIEGTLLKVLKRFENTERLKSVASNKLLFSIIYKKLQTLFEQTCQNTNKTCSKLKLYHYQDK